MTAIFVVTLPREESNATKKKTSEKLDELSRVLKESGSKIEQMGKEIEEKRQKAKELEELSERLEALKSLKEKQVSAIRGELESLFKRNATRSKIWTILNSAVWFFLGLLVRSLLGF